MKPRRLLLLMAGHINRISATKLQSQWITKAESSQTLFLSSEFHHIIERPFSYIKRQTCSESCLSLPLFVIDA